MLFFTTSTSFHFKFAWKHFILIIKMYVNIATEAFKSIQFQDATAKCEHKWWSYCYFTFLMLLSYKTFTFNWNFHLRSPECPYLLRLKEKCEWEVFIYNQLTLIFYRWRSASDSAVISQPSKPFSLSLEMFCNPTPLFQLKKTLTKLIFSSVFGWNVI